MIYGEKLIKRYNISIIENDINVLDEAFNPSEFIEKAKDKIKKIFEKFIDWLERLFERAEEFFTKIMNKIKDNKKIKNEEKLYNEIAEDMHTTYAPDFNKFEKFKSDVTNIIKGLTDALRIDDLNRCNSLNNYAVMEIKKLKEKYCDKENNKEFLFFKTTDSLLAVLSYNDYKKIRDNQLKDSSFERLAIKATIENVMNQAEEYSKNFERNIKIEGNDFSADEKEEIINYICSLSRTCAISKELLTLFISGTSYYVVNCDRLINRITNSINKKLETN